MSATGPAIAVLGTGRMGSSDRAQPPSSWVSGLRLNRTSARAKPLAGEGARLASSPAEAADGANVVLTMLADGDAVAGAMSGSDGALGSLRSGSTWIQMATVGVEWTERLASLATAHAVEFVERAGFWQRWPGP